MTITGFVVLSALLFSIGLVGVIVRRNVISIFFSLELLLNSVNVLFVGLSKVYGNYYGELFVFFVLAVAAAEAAVGLAIAVSLYRFRGSVNTEDFSSLRW